MRSVLPVFCAGLAKVGYPLLVALGAGLLLLLVPGLVSAAGEQPSIKQMKVSVWPEYDEPRVLVIYQGEFNDAGTFPRKVSFRLPPGADINQVCALKNGSDHLCQLFETSRDDSGVTLTYELPIPTFFLEFYYNPIEGAGQRSIAYEYTALTGIDSLQVDVLQPARASNFNVTPKAASIESDNRGLMYHELSVGKVAAGTPVKVDISYSKLDATPSVAKQQPSGGGNAAGDNFTNTYAVIAAGTLAMVGFVFYSARRRRQPLRQPTRPRYGPGYAAAMASRAPAGSPGNRMTHGPATVAFCEMCGSPVSADACFCAACGQSIRR